MKRKVSILLVLCALLLTGLATSACHWKSKDKPDSKQSVCKIENSADFEILPTMDTVSCAKNQVWVGTFQLIWNDLVDELLKNPVEFVGYKSEMAENLNRKEFTADDLNESSYYKKWGYATPELKKEIEKGIKEKFNETSDILDGFQWIPNTRNYMLYAMLKKDFQYLEPFDKLPEAPFLGSEGNVKYFGIDGNSSDELKSTVGVLFYNNNNDYAVSLKSKQGDTVYLYRTDDNKTFDSLYSDMTEKAKNYQGKKYFASIDRFKAPMLDFKSEREFPEICNKLIKNTDYIISKAIETVQFKMDETGVKLKSEAGIMMKCTSAGPGFREEPRYFYFDKRYVIFLQEKDRPYFAMKIEDVKKLQK